METTIGGDRLGSGNKQEISYRNYERSTHDLSYTWRSSMAAGTLIPFMNELALPGDHFSINLNCEVLTLPTVGPLFGSYKVQLDVFEVPLRLYNAKLHMNKLGIGMDMSKVFLPQIKLMTNNHAEYEHTWYDNEQMNPSCLLKYLGISGLGRPTGNANPTTREFCAIDLLAYWDIFKNYYSNKQEEKAYFIHQQGNLEAESMTPIEAIMYLPVEQGAQVSILDSGETAVAGYTVHVKFPNNCVEPDPATVRCKIYSNNAFLIDMLAEIYWVEQTKELIGVIPVLKNGDTLQVLSEPAGAKYTSVTGIKLQSFNLNEIDKMRESILQYSGQGRFLLDENTPFPYGCFQSTIGEGAALKYAMQYSQEGLAVKTYQSDLFNNWVNTEWIDGENGVSELTKVMINEDAFTIDALNIAQKVYVMLNRIAVSGGTYDDWLDAVYTHERVKSVESPIYMGSLIKELAFQEVVSNAETEGLPLGTLAGRGVLTEKHKGGKIEINVNEPSVIMGIVSLTPRVDYSQGNKWSVNLKTFDDFHKPALDAIGFQDLITEQLCWTDTANNNGTLTFKSLGKQPAWINYMTNVNKTYGNFAIEDNSMFMTLNRRYEKGENGEISDPTTYVDPTKFNNIFAETGLDSMNFWTQISCDVIARRKMSAKLIPNL